MINAMLLFYSLLGHQFILAIIALTILIRILVFPLSLKQQRSSLHRKNYLERYHNALRSTQSINQNHTPVL